MPTLSTPASAVRICASACDAEFSATFCASRMPVRPRSGSAAGEGSVVVAIAGGGGEVGDDAEGVAFEELELFAEVLGGGAGGVVEGADDDDAGDFADEGADVGDVGE